METVIQATASLLGSQQPTGLVGVLTILFVASWLHDRHKQAKLIEMYRTDMQAVLQRYGEHQRQAIELYQNNVHLCESWQKIAEGFQATVVLNTQTLTTVRDMIESNQFCPQMRKKQ